MKHLVFTSLLVLNLLSLYGQQCQNDSTGYIPISDLTNGTFNGWPGGLYPGGSNTMPAGHLTAGLQMAADIQPLDLQGNPDPDGKIGFICIGMSNCRQHFRQFSELAYTYPDLNPEVQMINCAQSGQDIDAIVNPNANYWNNVDNIIVDSLASNLQVQAVWFLQATHINNIPAGEGVEHVNIVANKFLSVFQHLKQRFPNLKQLYCSGRMYGDYSTGGGNPEPYAYYTGWSFKKLVRDQINNNPDLAYSGTTPLVPWLGWADYMWADGKNLRSDGLNWLCPDDFRSDGTHPSSAGREKWSTKMLDFFATDTTTQWFRADELNVNAEVLLERDAIIIFPNPTSNDLQVKLASGNYQLSILDINGNVYQTQNLNSDYIIDITQLPAGLYFVEIVNLNNSKIYVKKIIKE